MFMANEASVHGGVALATWKMILRVGVCHPTSGGDSSKQHESKSDVFVPLFSCCACQSWSVAYSHEYLCFDWTLEALLIWVVKSEESKQSYAIHFSVALWVCTNDVYGPTCLNKIVKQKLHLKNTSWDGVLVYHFLCVSYSNHSLTKFPAIFVLVSLQLARTAESLVSGTKLTAIRTRLDLLILISQLCIKQPLKSAYLRYLNGPIRL